MHCVDVVELGFSGGVDLDDGVRVGWGGMAEEDKARRECGGGGGSRGGKWNFRGGVARFGSL